MILPAPVHIVARSIYVRGYLHINSIFEGGGVEVSGGLPCRRRKFPMTLMSEGCRSTWEDSNISRRTGYSA